MKSFRQGKRELTEPDRTATRA